MSETTAKQPAALHGDAQSVLDAFTFPAEADVRISDPVLRKIIHEVYGAINFYNRAPLTLEDMRIDHVVPKSLGGPDNIFNYVPTCSGINGAKNAKFDAIAATATLGIVRTHYAPKILRKLEAARKAATAKCRGTTTPRPETVLRQARVAVMKNVRAALANEDSWVCWRKTTHTPTTRSFATDLRAALRAHPEAVARKSTTWKIIGRDHHDADLGDFASAIWSALNARENWPDLLSDTLSVSKKSTSYGGANFICQLVHETEVETPDFEFDIDVSFALLLTQADDAAFTAWLDHGEALFIGSSDDDRTPERFLAGSVPLVTTPP